MGRCELVLSPQLGGEIEIRETGYRLAELTRCAKFETENITTDQYFEPLLEVGILISCCTGLGWPPGSPPGLALCWNPHTLPKDEGSHPSY